MAEAPQARVALSNREVAGQFAAAFSAILTDLTAVLASETEHMSAGRITQGLAQEARKSELSGAYLKAVEIARANAVALARYVPEDVKALRRVHDEFRRVVERNQIVIATARAVSEGLVKSVAEDVARRSRPAGYGSAVPAGRPSAQPIAVSVRL